MTPIVIETKLTVKYVKRLEVEKDPKADQYNICVSDGSAEYQINGTLEGFNAANKQNIKWMMVESANVSTEIYFHQFESFLQNQIWLFYQTNYEKISTVEIYSQEEIENEHTTELS